MARQLENNLNSIVNHNTDHLLYRTLSSHTHAIIFILVFTITYEVEKLGTVVSPFLEMTKLKLSMPEATQVPKWQKKELESGLVPVLQHFVSSGPGAEYHQLAVAATARTTVGSPGPGSCKGMWILLNVL